MNNPMNLPWAMAITTLALFAGPASGAETARVSVSSAGVQANNGSTSAEIADGDRYVAFVSPASNLVAGDLNSFEDIFVHDRETGATILVSVSSNGTPGNQQSVDPGLTADGSAVVFTSSANNLVSGDSNASEDVFLHELISGATSRLSVSSGGTPGNGFSGEPAIAANGSVAAFVSDATNLVSGDSNGVRDVFVRNLTSGTTARVSLSSTGAQTNGSSAFPQLSADGRFVVFQSLASNLVSGDNNGAGDVFFHDTQTNVTTRVSVSSSGAEGNASSQAAVISADGRYVAFSSSASNLTTGDTNGVQDIFVHDRQSGTTTLVSVSDSGALSNADSFAPSLSADGNFVAFGSGATNLVAGDNNGVRDVFLRSLTEDATFRVSLSSSDAEGNASSSRASVSGDGRYVAFESAATNLVSGDSNGADDVFVRDRQTSAAPSSLAASVLPNGRAVQIGVAATTFASIINTDTDTATDCGIGLVDGALGTFSYQTTDPATNLPTGTVNTPVDIPGQNTSQSFVLSLTPTTELNSVDVRFVFDCTNTTPAPITSGLNTLLLSASSSAGPDVVAISATPSADGIVVLPGPSSANAFALATVNVGVGGNITASADTGEAELPLTLFICETDLLGQCLAPAASEVTTFMDADATSTFSVFVNAEGTIPLDPANSRITVRYVDVGDVTVGASSVAVTTQ